MAIEQLREVVPIHPRFTRGFRDVPAAAVEEIAEIDALELSQHRLSGIVVARRRLTEPRELQPHREVGLAGIAVAEHRHLARAERDLDEVPQLAHVARPMM